MNIKAIIFDWGGVLAGAETKQIYPESEEVLSYCSKKYRLALACIASKFEERKQQIQNSRLGGFFETIKVAPMLVEQISDPAFLGKDDLYNKIVEELNLPQEEILIIDDRVVRGIRYANQHRHPSIWVQRGKFAHELPNDQTGQPTYTVKSLLEIMKII
ncbi:MAG: HAD hydrolase-like protein [Candidatus Doudnabacteria bacterium]|nr:HAD hydrolase-like protein [Candidatus Doudnabacteria bacterium]